jgi:hypothetical protein
MALPAKQIGSYMSTGVQIPHWAPNKGCYMDYLIIVSQRYIDLLASKHSISLSSAASTEFEHLTWMLQEIQKSEMSETKANRWLGYVQGCLTMYGLISVEEEREFTRSIFNGK